MLTCSSPRHDAKCAMSAEGPSDNTNSAAACHMACRRNNKPTGDTLLYAWTLQLPSLAAGLMGIEWEGPAVQDSRNCYSGLLHCLPFIRAGNQLFFWRRHHTIFSAWSRHAVFLHLLTVHVVHHRSTFHDTVELLMLLLFYTVKVKTSIHQLR
jgi:hypothetical protein